MFKEQQTYYNKKNCEVKTKMVGISRAKLQKFRRRRAPVVKKAREQLQDAADILQ